MLIQSLHCYFKPVKEAKCTTCCIQHMHRECTYDSIFFPAWKPDRLLVVSCFLAMSLPLIWMKLVVPTATADDNTATALLTAALLLHGMNGCKYLNSPCYARGPECDAVVGGSVPLVLVSWFYCSEEEGLEWKEQRELGGKWSAAAECT